MCITSRVRQRGLVFLYPGLNYEEKELPCCYGRKYNLFCLPATTQLRQQSRKANGSQ